MTQVSAEAIALDSPCLVEASAGTGKTHAITTYFVRAIVELGLSPDQILVVTYTKAATAELRARTRTRLMQAISMLDAEPTEEDALSVIVNGAVRRIGRREVERALVDALGQMDQAAISTIHGFCQRVLQDFPLSFGIDFDFEVSEDARSLQRAMAIDFWAADLYDKPDWLLHALRDARVSVDYLARLAELATRPGVEVLGPEAVEIDDRRIEAWSESKARAAAIWAAERSTILGHLQSEVLNQSIYKPRSVEGWEFQIDAFFATPGWCPLPKFWRWLGQDNIDDKVKKDFDPPQHPFFVECEGLRRAAEEIREGFQRAAFDFQMRFLAYVRGETQKRKNRDAILTYDDLLTSVYAPFDTGDPIHDPKLSAQIASEVSNAFPLALVDEFQDTDSVQYGIFRAIWGEGSAVYVGDPKQAIYAFRGADVFSYIRAVDDVAGRAYALTTNRRSDPGLVDAVNTLFSRHEPPFLLEEIRMQPAVAHATRRSTFDPSLELLYLQAERLAPSPEDTVPPIVANEIGLLLQSDERIEGRPIEPGDIAVLCRTNRQASAVTAALRELRVPASLDGDASVLNTAIADELRAVLEAALLPGDGFVVRRALLTELLGVTPYELSEMGDEAWSNWVSRFSAWNDTWHRHGVVRFLEDLLRDTHAESRMARHPAARRHLTDLLHIEELLLRGERERQRDPFALMQWFRRLDENNPDRGSVDVEGLQQRPDAESGAVRVSTIHKSKGLEYGVVYVPFTWNDVRLFRFDRTAIKFHDADRNLKVDLGSANRSDHLAISQRENFSEAIRLLYVAVTRAKHRCTLFWGPARGVADSALGYLLHGRVDGARLDETRMRADVEAFVSASNGAADTLKPREERARPYEARHPQGALAVRAARRTFSHARRIASFTSLTGHDEKTPGPGRGVDVVERATGLFETLPAGARTGLLLHAVLERVSFEKLDDDDTLQLIAEELGRFGFDDTLGETVRTDLATVARTPLTTEPDAPNLAALSRDHQLRELEFTLGLDAPALAGLADVLERHGAPASLPGYHERLRRLGAAGLQPFLRGFIDLVFQWNGRWYVADYKSNLLPAYGPAEVSEAVAREHYALQAQLYTAAAHRFLLQRVPRYDPETQWGGSLFLFLRGMGGADHAGRSVFFDRQPASLLREVDAWLGGGDGSA